MIWPQSCASRGNSFQETCSVHAIEPEGEQLITCPIGFPDNCAIACCTIAVGAISPASLIKSKTGLSALVIAAHDSSLVFMSPSSKIIQIRGEDFFCPNNQIGLCGSREGLNPFMCKVLNIGDRDPVKSVRENRPH